MPCTVEKHNRLAIVSLGADEGLVFRPATLIAAFDALAHADQDPDIHAALIVIDANASGSLTRDPDRERLDLARVSARLHFPRASRNPTAWALIDRAFDRTLLLPTIAAIEGDCFDAGLAFVALHCDLRVAAEASRFGFPGLADADAAGFPVASTLDRQIGAAALNQLLERAEPVAADWALRNHLILESAPRHRVRQRAEALGDAIARLPRRVARTQKATLAGGDSLTGALASGRAQD